MLDQRLSPPKDLAAVFFRAMGLAWPVQLVVVVIWLLIPHPSGAHPLAVLLITLGAGGVYLPLLHPASDPGNRVMGNVGAVLGISYVSALVWAGGGLASGFELFALWFLPLAVYLLPRTDVIVQVPVVVLGWGIAASIGKHGLGVGSNSELWGLALIAASTAVVITGIAGYVYAQITGVSDLYRERSVKDALTGLANRSALAEYVAGVPASGAVYMLDVDGFKFVNDTLGHPAGDRLLGLLADRLRAHARTGDLLARTGGDEFVLIARADHQRRGCAGPRVGHRWRSHARQRR